MLFAGKCIRRLLAGLPFFIVCCCFDCCTFHVSYQYFIAFIFPTHTVQQRDIETEKPRREALRILSKIVDDLHRDNFSAQNYIHLVQRLPLRRRNLTEKMIIAKRDNVLLFDALEDYSKLYGENRLDGNGSRPYIKLSGPGKPKPKEESAEVKKMLQQRYRLKRFGGLDSSQRQQQQQQQSLPLQRSTEYNYTHQYQNISQIGYHQTQFQGQSNLVQQKMFQQNDLSQHQPQLQQPQPQHLQYPQHPQQPQHIQRARDFSSLEQRLPWFEASTSGEYIHFYCTYISTLILRFHCLLWF